MSNAKSPHSARRTLNGRSIRWNAALAQDYRKAGYWGDDTLADHAAHVAREAPDRILLIDDIRSLTAGELFAEASALATRLTKCAQPGDAVSFMLPNWHEAAIIYLATAMCGMVAHPILPSLRERELAMMLPDIGSRFIFIPCQFRRFDYARLLRGVCDGLDNPPEIVTVRGEAEGCVAFHEFLTPAPGFECPGVDADSVLMAMYTSGTTGMPKGVMHSHNSISALVRQLGEHWLVDKGDLFLVPSPISHIGGSIYAFEMPLMLGTTAVLMDHWDPDGAVSLFEAYHCTHMAGATPFLEGLLASCRKRNCTLPSLKLFICGGASVPPQLVREATGYFDKAIVSRVYGSTEVPVTTVGTIDANDLFHASESDGTPAIADVRIVAPDGSDSAEGEIIARGPQMLVGYVHAEDEAKVFDASGYYHTGDLGHWLDERFLTVSGRIKDIIIRKGENISPKEIEDVLINHPAIAEIAVVGVPDPSTGEKACAVIVAAGDSPPTLEDLKLFLAEQKLTKFKWPERLVVAKALPKNTTGKVLKHEIRASLAANAG